MFLSLACFHCSTLNADLVLLGSSCIQSPSSHVNAPFKKNSLCFASFTYQAMQLIKASWQGATAPRARLRQLHQAHERVPGARVACEVRRQLAVEHAVAVVLRRLPQRQRRLRRAQARQPLVQRAHRAHARPRPHQPCAVQPGLQGFRVRVVLGVCDGLDDLCLLLSSCAECLVLVCSRANRMPHTRMRACVICACKDACA